MDVRARDSSLSVMPPATADEKTAKHETKNERVYLIEIFSGPLGPAALPGQVTTPTPGAE